MIKLILRQLPSTFTLLAGAGCCLVLSACSNLCGSAGGHTRIGIGSQTWSDTTSAALACPVEVEDCTTAESDDSSGGSGPMTYAGEPAPASDSMR